MKREFSSGNNVYEIGLYSVRIKISPPFLPPEEQEWTQWTPWTEGERSSTTVKSSPGEISDLRSDDPTHSYRCRSSVVRAPVPESRRSHPRLWERGLFDELPYLIPFPSNFYFSPVQVKTLIFSPYLSFREVKRTETLLLPRLIPPVPAPRGAPKERGLGIKYPCGSWPVDVEYRVSTPERTLYLQSKRNVPNTWSSEPQIKQTGNVSKI